MSDLSILKNTRKYFRGRLTNCHNNSGTYSDLDEVTRDSRKNLIVGYNDKLKDLNIQISNIKFKNYDDSMERDFNNELNECDEYEVKFQECIARLGSRGNNTSVNRNNSNPNSSEQLRTLLKCPVAPLPTFSSGDGEDLSKFFRNFEDTIVRFNYPD